ncbi:MAG: hypothetical protein KBA71_08160 [Opitutaceae bacterium]|nr:hypothetical protein [Opitutaceae bacterium]
MNRSIPTFGIFVFAVALCAATPPPVPGDCDPFLNPFNKLSAHHRPVGAGAVYGVPGTDGEPTRGRIAIVTRIGLSMAPATRKYIHRVMPADPPRTVTFNEEAAGSGGGKGLPITLRMPAGVPYPSVGEDRNVVLWPRDGSGVDLCVMFYGFDNERGTARYAKSWPFGGLDYVDGSDGFDSGSSASRLRWPSGVLRGFEINPANPAPIRHAFQATATRHGNPDNRNSPKAPPSRHVLGKTHVWPAYGTDAGASNPNANLGDIPYGTRLVIRRQDFALKEKLGLSPRGRVIFATLCYYGMYVVDGQGQYDAANDGAVIQQRCDHAVTREAAEDVNAQLMKILPLLWPMRNPRPLDCETEIFSGDGLPYAGGGGPLDPAQSINSAWDVK